MIVTSSDGKLKKIKLLGLGEIFEFLSEAIVKQV